MKNQMFPANFGRQLALAGVTLVLVLSAADRGRAAAGHGDWQQASQTAPSRGQGAAAPRSDAAHQPQPRLPWWKDPAVIKEINLTPDQATRIDSVWRKRDTEMQAVAKEYERQREELNRLMADRRVGLDVIGLQLDRVEAQRTILNKSRWIALYQSSLILSADQNKALKAIGERNRRDRR